MVRLRVLAGSSAGLCFDAAQLPIRVGRGSGHDLTLDEPGVWPGHCLITREQNDLLIQAGPEALVSVNDAPVQQTLLRNGDIISLGAVKLRFGFVPVRQRPLRGRECLIWMALAGLVACEIGVAYSLW